MTMIWIDTTSGTWGPVSHGNGRLVLVDLNDSSLEELSDSDIADYGLMHGRDPVPMPTTDGEALDVIHEIRKQRGFGMLIMTRADAAYRWHQMDADPDDDDDPDTFTAPSEAQITDEEWERVKRSHSWRKGWTSDSLMEDAWYIVDSAIEQAREAAEQDPGSTT